MSPPQGGRARLKHSSRRTPREPWRLRARQAASASGVGPKTRGGLIVIGLTGISRGAPAGRPNPVVTRLRLSGTTLS